MVELGYSFGVLISKFVSHTQLFGRILFGMIGSLIGIVGIALDGTIGANWAAAALMLMVLSDSMEYQYSE